MTVESLFKERLAEYQKNINNFVIRFCIIGGFGGIGYILLMKIIGVYLIDWSQIIKAIIPVSLSLLILAVSYFVLKNKQQDVIYIKVFKFILITVASMNAVSLCLFLPYRDTWTFVCILHFLCMFYLDKDSMIYGIIIATFIAFISYVYSSPDKTVSDLVTRAQSILFINLFSYVGCILSRKLLKKSCENEFNTKTAISNLERIFEKVNNVSQELSVSSKNITVLATTQQEALGSMSKESAEILAESNDLMKGTQQSVNLCEDVVNGNISVMEQVNRAIEIARQLSESIVLGEEILSNTENAIIQIEKFTLVTYDSAKDVDEKAREIDGILGSIKNLAEQTNLLSLNASIEAERAGQYGRGFAVVASEIKKLSERSKSSLIEISQSLKDIFSHEGNVDNLLEKVKQGIEQVSVTKKHFEVIKMQISDVENHLSNIKDHAEKQIEIGKVLNIFINKVNTVSETTCSSAKDSSNFTEETYAVSEEILKSVKYLENLSDELVNIIKN